MAPSITMQVRNKWENIVLTADMGALYHLAICEHSCCCYAHTHVSELGQPHAEPFSTRDALTDEEDDMLDNYLASKQ